LGPFYSMIEMHIVESYCREETDEKEEGEIAKEVKFTYVKPPKLHSSFTMLYSGAQLIFTVDFSTG